MDDNYKSYAVWQQMQDSEEEGGEEEKKPIIQEFKANHGYILLYVITMALNTINVAWTTAGHNQVSPIFAAKLNWTAEETRLNNSLINFASNVGKALGAVIGGKIIEKGRKSCFITYNILSIFACLAMQYMDLYTIMAAKFIHGLFVTYVHMSNVKMINETLPEYLKSQYGTYIAVVMTSGYTLTMIVGLGLPEEDYNPALPKTGKNKSAYAADQQDEFWRFILFVPVIINLIMLSVFFCCIQTDSIMYNLSHGEDEQALKLIDRVYDTKTEDRDEILKSLKSQVKVKAKSDVPYCQSLFGGMNLRTTLTMMGFTSLIQMSTVNVINMYCNRIFTVMNVDIPEENKVLANTATQIFGWAGFGAVIISPFIQKRFKNRIPVLKAGQVAITLSLLGLAGSIQMKNGLMAVLFIILWNPSYQWSIASIHWVYIGDVSSDVQFGFISGIHYSNAVYLSWTTEYMMASWGAHGMFYFFAVINFIGFFFVTFCMKETNGLSDKQKKALYQPSQ